MFISELFEAKGQVPSNPKQKQGPAGQARGTDKAPFRNKLVGETHYDAGDYTNARLGRAYGLPRMGLTTTTSTGSDNRADGRHSGDKEDMPTPKGDIFGRNKGEVPTGKTGKVHRIAKPEDMDEAMERTPDQGAPNFQKPMFGEGDNPQDEITVDVPLLIRLLEYAREDAKSDMDLHNVAENLIKLSGQGCLSMKQYNQIVGSMKEMAPGRSAYAGRGNVPGMASA